MLQTINPSVIEKGKEAGWKKSFDEAHPYRHLVIDDFLKPEVAEELHQHFPTVEALKVHWKGLNENKAEGSNFEDFHPVFSSVKADVFSKEFYQWVSAVTGIEDVFVTDDQMGAGLHQGTDGSFLDIHIDFNIHHVKNVHRRLNLLIYLEKDWKKEFGGELEMWNADMTALEKSVLPAFNRAVVFETSEISYHGYSKINVPEGVTRKSFFTYFYTDLRDDAVAYHDTVFKARPTESTSKKVKTAVKETMKNKAKATLKKLGVKF